MKKPPHEDEQQLEEFFREQLKPFVGAPLTADARAGIQAVLDKMTNQLLPTELQAVANVVGDTIKVTMKAPSFASQILPARPRMIAPFRKWRADGPDQLTHRVGTFPYVRGNGTTAWKRFCDDETVDPQFLVLTRARHVVVDCLGCIAVEDTIDGA